VKPRRCHVSFLAIRSVIVARKGVWRIRSSVSLGRSFFVLPVRRRPRHDFVALGDLFFDLVISGRRFPKKRPAPILRVRASTRETARIMIEIILGH
jgi:hypothetical protein